MAAGFFADLLPLLGAGARGYMEGRDRQRESKTADTLQRLREMQIASAERSRRPVSSLYPGVAEAAVADRPSLSGRSPDISEAPMDELQNILGLFETKGQEKARELSGRRAGTAAENAVNAAFREIRLTYKDPLDAARASYRLAEKRIADLEADLAEGAVFPEEAEPLLKMYKMRLAEAEMEMQAARNEYGTAVKPGAESLRERHGLRGGPAPQGYSRPQVDDDEFNP